MAVGDQKVRRDEDGAGLWIKRRNGKHAGLGGTNRRRGGAGGLAMSGYRLQGKGDADENYNGAHV